MLSIIIPTLNEEKYLPLLLESIKKQNIKNYEIILADNNSKDKTRQIAKKYKCKVVKGGFPSKARNQGAKFAKGELLFFLDADVLLTKDFLKIALKEFKERELDLTTSRFYPIKGNIIDKLAHHIANLFMIISEKIKPFGPGFCILIKREVHEKIKGFDETLVLAEDHDYLERASKVGKFRILKNTKLLISTRRFKKDGRWNTYIKYIKVTLKLLKGKKIRKEDNVKYDFGKYNEF